MIIDTWLILSTVKAVSTTATTTTVEVTTPFSHALHYMPLFYSLIHKLNININHSKVSLKCITINMSFFALCICCDMKYQTNTAVGRLVFFIWQVWRWIWPTHLLNSTSPSCCLTISLYTVIAPYHWYFHSSTCLSATNFYQNVLKIC